jgi:hypothetical protein
MIKERALNRGRNRIRRAIEVLYINFSILYILFFKKVNKQIVTVPACFIVIKRHIFWALDRA